MRCEVIQTSLEQMKKFYYAELHRTEVHDGLPVYGIVIKRRRQSQSLSERQRVQRAAARRERHMTRTGEEPYAPFDGGRTDHNLTVRHIHTYRRTSLERTYAQISDQFRRVDVKRASIHRRDQQSKHQS